MPYNSRIKQLEHYYKNRNKILKRQKEYDRLHKKEKRKNDRKRREQQNYNLIKRVHKYSRIYHFP